MNYSKWLYHNKSLGLLVLRVGIGIVMLIHGIQKLENIHGTIMFFNHIGFGIFWAWVVMLVETLGGIALILGIGTQIAASFIAIEMLVIILFLYSGKSFPSYNLEFTILIATLALALMGSGKYSLAKKCKSCRACDCACHGGNERCAEGKCESCGCK